MAKGGHAPFAGILDITVPCRHVNVSYRSPIDHREMQRFSIQEDRPPPAKPVMSNGELVPVSLREIQYNMISEFWY